MARKAVSINDKMSEVLKRSFLRSETASEALNKRQNSVAERTSSTRASRRFRKRHTTTLSASKKSSRSLLGSSRSAESVKATKSSAKDLENVRSHRGGSSAEGDLWLQEAEAALNRATSIYDDWQMKSRDGERDARFEDEFSLESSVSEESLEPASQVTTQSSVHRSSAQQEVIETNLTSTLEWAGELPFRNGAVESKSDMQEKMKALEGKLADVEGTLTVLEREMETVRDKTSPGEATRPRSEAVEERQHKSASTDVTEEKVNDTRPMVSEHQDDLPKTEGKNAPTPKVSRGNLDASSLTDEDYSEEDSKTRGFPGASGEDLLEVAEKQRKRIEQVELAHASESASLQESLRAVQNDFNALSKENALLDYKLRLIEQVERNPEVLRILAFGAEDSEIQASLRKTYAGRIEELTRQKEELLKEAAKKSEQLREQDGLITKLTAHISENQGGTGEGSLHLMQQLASKDEELRECQEALSMKSKEMKEISETLRSQTEASDTLKRVYEAGAGELRDAISEQKVKLERAAAERQRLEKDLVQAKREAARANAKAAAKTQRNSGQGDALEALRVELAEAKLENEDLRNAATEAAEEIQRLSEAQQQAISEVAEVQQKALERERQMLVAKDEELDAAASSAELHGELLSQQRQKLQEELQGLAQASRLREEALERQGAQECQRLNELLDRAQDELRGVKTASEESATALKGFLGRLESLREALPQQTLPPATFEQSVEQALVELTQWNLDLLSDAEGVERALSKIATLKEVILSRAAREKGDEAQTAALKHLEAQVDKAREDRQRYKIDADVERDRAEALQREKEALEDREMSAIKATDEMRGKYLQVCNGIQPNDSQDMLPSHEDIILRLAELQQKAAQAAVLAQRESPTPPTAPTEETAPEPPKGLVDQEVHVDPVAVCNAEVLTDEMKMGVGGVDETLRQNLRSALLVKERLEASLGSAEAELREIKGRISLSLEKERESAERGEICEEKQRQTRAQLALAEREAKILKRQLDDTHSKLEESVAEIGVLKRARAETLAMLNASSDTDAIVTEIRKFHQRPSAAAPPTPRKAFKALTNEIQIDQVSQLRRLIQMPSGTSENLGNPDFGVTPPKTSTADSERDSGDDNDITIEKKLADTDDSDVSSDAVGVGGAAEGGEHLQGSLDSAIAEGGKRLHGSSGGAAEGGKRLQGSLDGATEGEKRLQGSLDGAAEGAERPQGSLDSAIEGRKGLHSSLDGAAEGGKRLQGSLDSAVEGGNRLQGSLDGAAKGGERLQGSLDGATEGEKRLQGSLDGAAEGAERPQGSLDSAIEGRKGLHSSLDGAAEGGKRLQGSLDSAAEGGNRLQGSLDGAAKGGERLQGSLDGAAEGEKRLQGSLDSAAEGGKRLQGSLDGAKQRQTMPTHNSERGVVPAMLVNETQNNSAPEKPERPKTLRAVSEVAEVRSNGAEEVHDSSAEHNTSAENAEDLIREVLKSLSGGRLSLPRGTTMLARVLQLLRKNDDEHLSKRQAAALELSASGLRSVLRAFPVQAQAALLKELESIRRRYMVLTNWAAAASSKETSNSLSSKLEMRTFERDELQASIEDCGAWRAALYLSNGQLDAELDVDVWPVQQQVEILKESRAFLRRQLETYRSETSSMARLEELENLLHNAELERHAAQQEVMELQAKLEKVEYRRSVACEELNNDMAVRDSATQALLMKAQEDRKAALLEIEQLKAKHKELGKRLPRKGRKEIPEDTSSVPEDVVFSERDGIWLPTEKFGIGSFEARRAARRDNKILKSINAKLEGLLLRVQKDIRGGLEDFVRDFLTQMDDFSAILEQISVPEEHFERVRRVFELIGAEQTDGETPEVRVANALAPVPEKAQAESGAVQSLVEGCRVVYERCIQEVIRAGESVKQKTNAVVDYMSKQVALKETEAEAQGRRILALHGRLQLLTKDLQGDDKIRALAKRVDKLAQERDLLQSDHLLGKGKAPASSEGLLEHLESLVHREQLLVSTMSSLTMRKLLLFRQIVELEECKAADKQEQKAVGFRMGVLRKQAAVLMERLAAVKWERARVSQQVVSLFWRMDRIMQLVFQGSSFKRVAYWAKAVGARIGDSDARSTAVGEPDVGSVVLSSTKDVETYVAQHASHQRENPTVSPLLRMVLEHQKKKTEENGNLEIPEDESYVSESVLLDECSSFASMTSFSSDASPKPSRIQGILSRKASWSTWGGVGKADSSDDESSIATTEYAFKNGLPLRALPATKRSKSRRQRPHTSLDVTDIHLPFLGVLRSSVIEKRDLRSRLEPSKELPEPTFLISRVHRAMVSQPVRGDLQRRLLSK